MLGLPPPKLSTMAEGSSEHSALFSRPSGGLPITMPSPRVLGSGGRGGAPVAAGDPGSKRKQCNCRNSRCLKLYCECFASGQYCFGCNCQGCHNNPENDDKRKRAIDATLER